MGHKINNQNNKELIESASNTNTKNLATPHLRTQLARLEQRLRATSPLAVVSRLTLIIGAIEDREQKFV